ncbi:hypothetical protein ABW20_dc0109067 [Dactylellina cionopaga]|nr:hypothetical protein ABW20_dc0109067 [Dactylellina cionopaga]
MSTIAIKLTSLAIRTLAKPIANSIKQQAKEHPRFRTVCIALAQVVHRTDMRIRLSLLRDSSVIEKAEEEEERRKSTEKSKEGKDTIAKMAMDALKDGKHEHVKTKGADTANPFPSPPAFDSDSVSHPTLALKKKKPSTPHIRPLSDSKAIEKGANFISEAFLFSVAGGLILFEALRSRKKEMNRRDEVSERLQNLEEVDEIWRRKVEMLERRLDKAGIKKVPELPLAEPEQKPLPSAEGWISKIGGFFSKSTRMGEEPPPQQVPTRADGVTTKA